MKSKIGSAVDRTPSAMRGGRCSPATAKADVAGYLAFLRNKAARDIFEKFGFTFLGAKPST